MKQDKIHLEIIAMSLTRHIILLKLQQDFFPVWEQIETNFPLFK